MNTKTLLSEHRERLSLKAIIRFMRYFLAHKWYVFVECLRFGIPWPGIVHDASKLFSPECYWFIKYFEWTDNRPEWFLNGLNMAKEHHAKHNQHHWQWWLQHDRKNACPMNHVSRREMLADMIAKGKDAGGLAAYSWYIKQKKDQLIILHPDTRAWLEEQLGHNSDDE